LSLAAGQPAHNARMEPADAIVREQLVHRLHEIADELREYPQPIARCDAQLGALIAEQDTIREQIARLDRRAAAGA
jgi:hypothetical protein